jgi:hypothetical protein
MLTPRDSESKDGVGHEKAGKQGPFICHFPFDVFQLVILEIKLGARGTTNRVLQMTN